MHVKANFRKKSSKDDTTRLLINGKEGYDGKRSAGNEWGYREVIRYKMGETR